MGLIVLLVIVLAIIAIGYVAWKYLPPPVGVIVAIIAGVIAVIYLVSALPSVHTH